MAVLTRLRTAEALLLALAASLTPLSLVLVAWRWQIILAAMNRDISFWRSLLIILGVWPLSAISPSRSGDLLRAYSLRTEVQSTHVVGSVLTEHLFDIFVLSSLSLVGSLVLERGDLVMVSGGILGSFLLGLVVIRRRWRLPLSPSWQQHLDNLIMSVQKTSSVPKDFLPTFVLTLANWLVSLAQFMVLFRAVGVQVPTLFAMSALPIAIFAGILPFTFGGMGTRDSAIIVLFSGHATTDQCLSVSLVYVVFAHWLLAVVSLPFMSRALKLDKK
ncbi:flippase-like domain-containing protein [Acidobacteria bacterium AH-259-D05]|nr:flippase-like domain-containing protein [Acidobacteria bacterium AH-259-D05]